MSKSVVIRIQRTDPFLKGFGAVARRLEVEGVEVDHAAPDLGIGFEANSIDFADVCGSLFRGEIVRELQAGLSPEQAASLCLLEGAAGRCGFELELETSRSLSGPVVNLVLKPGQDLDGMFETSFGNREERKALPPARTWTDPFSGLFEDVRTVKDAVTARKGAKRE